MLNELNVTVRRLGSSVKTRRRQASIVTVAEKAVPRTCRRRSRGGLSWGSHPLVATALPNDT